MGVGSSIKICLVAEGKANLYPRFAPTSDWDTCAANIVAECAGATVLIHNQDKTDAPCTDAEYKYGAEMYYPKNGKNPYFVVYCKVDNDEIENMKKIRQIHDAIKVIDPETRAKKAKTEEAPAKPAESRVDRLKRKFQKQSSQMHNVSD